MNSLENKTILVTGASGFIGSHLARRLVGVPGVRLLLLSRQSKDSGHPHVRWLKGSLTELKQEFWHRSGINNIDVVFHLGAFIPKAGHEANDIERVYQDNLLGTRTLLEGLPDGVQRIVFSSTIDVYAPPSENEAPITEKSHPDPAALYGASKLFCEKLISAWAADCQSNFSILRYGHIFGPGEEKFCKLIPVTIRKVLAGESPVIHGYGLAERDMLYVEDAVEAAIRAADMNEDVGPVNIVRGESATIREIVKKIILICGSRVNINYMKEKSDGSSFRFDNTLMRQTLGEWPLVTLDDGLAKEIDAFSGG